MDSNFDDINLDTPKQDLNIKRSENKINDFISGGGGWGGGWGKASSWGFGGVGNTANDKKDATAEAAPANTNSIWNIGSNKKDKIYEKDLSAFDFDLADKNTSTHVNAGKVDAKKEVETWSEFGSKEKKNSKKGGSSFAALDQSAHMNLFEAEENQDDTGWPSWGVGKKDNKGTKKGFATEEPIPPPPPPASKSVQAEANDVLWGSVNKKKKGKKDGDKAPVKMEDSLTAVVPEPDSVGYGGNDDFIGADPWNSWGEAEQADKTDKKRGTKNEPAASPMARTDPAPGYGAPPVQNGMWDNLGSSSNKEKDKKKGVTNGYSSYHEPVRSEPAAEKPVAEDGMKWDTPAGKTGDKKKGQKGVVKEAFPPPPPPAPEAPPGAIEHGNWPGEVTWGNSKADKKGARNGKVAEPDPSTEFKTPKSHDSTMKPDDADDAGEERWNGGWGFNKKDRKMKDPTKDAPVEIAPGKTPPLPLLQPDSITEDRAATEEDTWGDGMWGLGANKDKKKTTATGKKATNIFQVPPPVPTPPNQGLTPGNSPPPGPNHLDDNFEEFGLEDWNTPAAGKAKKKDGKPEATASNKNKATAGKLDRKSAKEPPHDLMKDLGDASKLDPPDVEEFKTKEETPAKAVKSFWGFGGGSTATKAKTVKEKEQEKKDKEAQEKKEKEAEKAQRELEDAELAALMDEPITEVAGKKDLKKSSALASKEDKKAKKSAGAAKVEDIAKVDDFAPIPAPEGKKNEAWSFWGATKEGKEKEKEEKEKEKKTAGQKDKEIGNDKRANQKTSLVEPQPPTLPDPSREVGIKSTSTATAAKASVVNTSKTAAKSSAAVAGVGTVADKVKAFQARDIDQSADAWPPAPPQEPNAEREAKVVESKRPAIARKSTVTSTKLKNKSLSPEPETVKVPSQLPGGFPDDDLIDVTAFQPAAFPPAAFPSATFPPVIVPSPAMPLKANKVPVKTEKKSKESKAAEIINVVEVPVPPPPPVNEFRKISPELKKKSRNSELAKPPTPPPEPEPEVKSAKKERPRIDRGQQSSSWGFWGACKPSESTKNEKDDPKVPPLPRENKPEKPSLTRSKSARKPSERDVEKSSRSSNSDELKKPQSRPSNPSRGLSFSGMFGGGSTPSRSKSTRDPPSSAKPSSRRRSMVVDGGLPSPLSDDQLQFKVSDKAAKTLGIGGSKLNPSKSARDTGKTRAAPDPYAIDDDVVMVDTMYDDAPPPSKAKASTSKRESSKAMKDDDPLLVDPYGPWSGPEVVTDPDDLAFVETPKRPPVKRSASSAKKTEGLMGLFGSMRRKEGRPSFGNDDDGKRLRRDSRKIERPRRTSDLDMPSADGAPNTDAEDAQRAERRAKRAERDAAAKEARAAELADAEDRAARRKEKERAARRAEKEAELRKQEERRERRAAREEKMAQEEAAVRDAEDARRRRRREDAARELPPKANGGRPTSDRRRSYQPDSKPRDREFEDDYGSRPRHDDRRTSRRSNGPVATPDEKTSRRRSTQVVDDYFDPRNGGPNGKPVGRPYLPRGDTDKTTSWVQSVNQEPPLPPPVEGSVVEGEPDRRYVAKERPRGDRNEPRMSSYRKERESQRERVRNGGGDRNREVERERTKLSDGSRSGAGSPEKERRNNNYSDDYSAPSPQMARTFDGMRPPPPAKRGSWLKKIAGF